MRPTSRPRGARTFTLFAVCLLALGTTAASCGDQPSGVSVGAVQRGAVAEIVDAPASVTARAAATLTAPAEGTLRSLPVGPGDRVRAGQIVAVIDSPPARERLAQASKALAAAKRASGGVGGVNLTGASRRTDRAAQEAFEAARAAAGRIADPATREALLKQVTVAERQYDAAARAADEAIRAVQRGVAGLSSAVGALGAAQRMQAQQAYDLAKSTVDALTLRAPIAGVVQLGGVTGGAQTSLSDLLNAAGAGGAVPGPAPAAAGGASGGAPLPGVDGAVPVGGQVGAGTAVLTIVDTRELGLLAEVDETDVLLVTPGATGTVELDAATGATYETRVRAVDVLPTQSSRGGVAYKVRLTLGPGKYPDGRAAPTPRPGMSAVAHLRVREAADAVTVPAAAVFSADGGDAVWAVRDGRATRVPVTVGVQGQDVVQILAGLGAGERVVVRGADQVRDGQSLS
ncbi:efflux RND transporter periplasmic adaptor subunit [Rhizomonospora bruguierae]|uniref:efflux RND transporter periplasmic adaptor subunit n=1 Tax=Rhizomonospora bruguierae TaxID=1581705 RepID=UPI001BCFDE84|nr:HlyD family efflux transporter periplasmic adaptor subunit [Micromonospora sp. NBRC 107566]